MTDRKEPQLGEVEQAPRDDRIPTLTEIVAIDDDSNAPPAPRITRWDTDSDAPPLLEPRLPDPEWATGNDPSGPVAFQGKTATSIATKHSNRPEQDPAAPAEPDPIPHRHPEATNSAASSPITPPYPGECASDTGIFVATEPGAAVEPAPPNKPAPAAKTAPSIADTVDFTAVPDTSRPPPRGPIEAPAVDFSAYDFVAELAVTTTEPPRSEPDPAVSAPGTTLELSSEELEVLADRVLDALAPVLRETVVTVLYEILAGHRHKSD